MNLYKEFIFKIAIYYSPTSKKTITKLYTPMISRIEKLCQEKNLKLSSESSDLLSQGFTEGPAELRVMAQDCSFLKRRADFHQKIAIDITPPDVEVRIPVEGVF